MWTIDIYLIFSIQSYILEVSKAFWGYLIQFMMLNRIIYLLILVDVCLT